MDSYCKDYFSCIYTFLLNDGTVSKKILLPDVKYRLDSIKAKMVAHVNMHAVKYDENIDNRMKCLHLAEEQFNTLVASLYAEDILHIDTQLHKLKSVQDMLILNCA